MLRTLLPTLLLISCTAAQADVPGPIELKLAGFVDCPTEFETVRDVRCTGLAEERTEFRCQFVRVAASGARQSEETVLARDGGRWIVIDAPSLCSQRTSN